MRPTDLHCSLTLVVVLPCQQLLPLLLLLFLSCTLLLPLPLHLLLGMNLWLCLRTKTPATCICWHAPMLRLLAGVRTTHRAHVMLSFICHVSWQLFHAFILIHRRVIVITHEQGRGSCSCCVQHCFLLACLNRSHLHMQ